MVEDAVEEGGMIFPEYEVVAFSLHGLPLPIGQYRHDAPFVEDDTRIIRYAGGMDIEQVFQGDTETGGWYDLD
jgi:hypothetical protein